MTSSCGTVECRERCARLLTATWALDDGDAGEAASVGEGGEMAGDLRDRSEGGNGESESEASSLSRLPQD